MQLIELINLFFSALRLMVLVYVLGSWFPSFHRSPIFRALSDVIDPLLEPFRRILPPQRLGGLDISPIFLILVLGVVQNVLGGLLVPRSPY